MPNTSVRATAEGLPVINRRSILGGLAAATALVAADHADAAEAAKSIGDRLNHHGAAFMDAIDDLFLEMSGGKYGAEFYSFNEEETGLVGIVYKLRRAQ